MKKIIYQGSKNRLSKFIIPILQEYIDKNNIETFIDPFCGGANVIDKIQCKNLIASDYNEELIALLRYAQKDNQLSIAPNECTFEHYSDVKSNRGTGKYSQEYTALIGYCASYGGRYFDGEYGRSGSDKRSKFHEAVRNLKKQAPKLKEINFYVRNYTEYLSMNITNALFYLDPPYRGTKKYMGQNIDYEEFYTFCREISKNNIVVVSEYSMPDDFICIWQKEVGVNQDSKRSKEKKAIEKLWTLN